ncbi:hypothetical protein PSH47_04905 [Pseudoalteromonas sp. CST5]|uniref:hypothetical protein n=1 Tax=unclassified Pseudoalteromonas TaxID=194690 RepID=UPI002358F234|nr:MULTISPECIES: hypothetical protein [unclassified Pseudoalteromonas]MDC9513099.1 hypothetical protein [Pseudoalteromonas sp. CST1]MDC9537164.1 hypothetical protein [Pseudoalteromonas sp. CST3]MDC9541478.1 hypothetical protein [Pseudoalteromonas sp. CST2]MDC9545757.1 hypothetical protein [Pseudoalteromonas sp. CST4]MDC9548509.1 hypothetical protein [Pseudoalteromonas sp. CST5]
MIIKIHKLVVAGPNKPPAKLILNGKSHLVFGPTDTGKSYIVECIRYCFGGGQEPKGVGYSDGYTRASVQISLSNNDSFTLFRDQSSSEEAVYEGFHETPPQDATRLEKSISELLQSWCGATAKKILIKSGKLGNLTAGDLRRLSIFDEIETLDNVSFEGKDTNLKTRNKSALAMVLSGTDDADMILPPSTNDRNIAKGHVEAINEQINSLLADVPKELSLQDAEDSLEKVTSQIKTINCYMRSHAAEIAELRKIRLQLTREGKELSLEHTALKEAENRFLLLNKKYVSDQQRLQAMSTAASITESFEVRSCPLCYTDIQHQFRHLDQATQVPMLRLAARVEYEKIARLRKGLEGALNDILLNLDEASEALTENEKQVEENERKQNELLSPKKPSEKYELETLSDRKVMLSIAIANLTRVEKLRIQLTEMQNKSKRRKQLLNRDLSESSSALCKRVKELLDAWGVPGVDSIYFNEAVSDLEINQRKRISYGKGKRGIFLTAYMVALMEKAAEKGYPHLGFVIIDSPVVTYKDPKHGPDSANEELLDESVKDRFYSWLANRTEPGQILILENEDPKEDILPSLNVTEFVGPEGVVGRKGFFPI